MQLVALTGFATIAKERVAIGLVDVLLTRGRSVTLLDNGDRPLRLATVPTVRLRGCACCTVAAELVPLVAPLSSDVVLLLVSALADPRSLHRVLARLRALGRSVTTVAVTARAAQPSYLLGELRAAADVVYVESAPLDELLARIAPAPAQPDVEASMQGGTAP